MLVVGCTVSKNMVLSADMSGGSFDLGGQWISKTQWRASSLARYLELGTYLQDTTGVNLAQAADQSLRWTGDTPLSLALVLAFAKLEWLAHKVDVNEPYNPSSPVAHFDQMTLRTWLDQNISDPSTRSLIASALMTVFADNLENLSMLHVLFYIRSNWSLVHLVGMRVFLPVNPRQPTTSSTAPSPSSLLTAPRACLWASRRLWERSTSATPPLCRMLPKRPTW